MSKPAPVTVSESENPPVRCHHRRVKLLHDALRNVDPAQWDPAKWEIKGKVNEDLKNNHFDGVMGKYKDLGNHMTVHWLLSNQGWAKSYG